MYCLAYKSLDCVAVEFAPDDRGKAYIEDNDKGTCYIQRRNSASVSITKDPSRHVFMLYQNEPEAALTLSVLASSVRVNDQLLRYHSACNASSINGVCHNTYGSYTCVCNQVAGYIPSVGNASCVKAGELGTYTPADGVVEACPKLAWTPEGATSKADCYCPSGSNLRVTSWSNATEECSQCGAGLFSNVNSSCMTCHFNSWSLPGTIKQSNCLCNPGFYMDMEALQQGQLDADEANSNGNKTTTRIIIMACVRSARVLISARRVCAAPRRARAWRAQNSPTRQHRMPRASGTASAALRMCR